MKILTRRGKVLTGVVALTAALLCGCGNSDNFVFTNQGNQVEPVQPVQPPAFPLAVDDAFPALGNATLNQAAPGVLANDTLNTAEISEFEAVGSQGGAIALNADGSFTYTPVTGFKGMETFSYTLTNETGSSTATVTLTSTGFGRFVDNSLPDGGTGTQADPFDTLAEAITAAQPGDTVYVAQGNAKYLGGLTLPQGVNLVGEGTGLILGQTVEPAGTAPVLEGPIRPAGDNTIKGVTVDGSVMGELVQLQDVDNVILTRCTFSNPDSAVFILGENIGGTLSVTHSTFEQPADTNEDYINLENDSVDGTFTITDNTFLNAASNNTEELLDVTTRGTTSLSLDFSRNVALGSQPDTFEYALFANRSSDTSSLELTCQDNTLTNFSACCIAVDDVFGVISGNIITYCDDGISVILDESNLVVSGNQLTNINGEGISLSNLDSASTCVVENNVLANCSLYGVFVSGGAGSLTRVAARNNTISDSGTNSLLVSASNGADVCAEVVGNTVNDDMLFDGVNTGMVRIERRDQLQAINTFLAGMPMFQGNTSDVAAGSCMIP